MLLRNIAQNFSTSCQDCCTKLLATFLIFVFLTLETAQASVSYGIGRTRSCNAGNDGEVTVEGLDWNPTYGGKDIDFVLSNPVCFSFAITSYASVKAAIAGMNYACGTGSGVPRLIPTPLLDVYDIGKATLQ